MKVRAFQPTLGHWLHEESILLFLVTNVLFGIPASSWARDI